MYMYIYIHIYIYIYIYIHTYIYWHVHHSTITVLIKQASVCNPFPVATWENVRIVTNMWQHLANMLAICAQSNQNMATCR